MPMTAVTDPKQLAQAVSDVTAACADVQALSKAGIRCNPPKIDEGIGGWEGFHVLSFGIPGKNPVRFSFATAPSPEEEVYFHRLGLIAADEQGGIHLMHQDRIERGKRGAGQDTSEVFDALWEGPEPMDVTRARGNEENPRRWIRAARIDSGPEVFATEMAAFLRHWEDMRTAVRLRHLPEPEVENEAEEEGEHLSSKSPRRRLKAFLSKTPASSTMVEPIHDLIVERVVEILEERKVKTGHNAEIDLWAEGVDGGVTHIYEIKPSGSRDSVYKGVGQLLINRQALLDGGVKSENADDIVPVLVVGDDIQAPMAKLARRLGVRVVRVYVAPDKKGVTLVDGVPCMPDEKSGRVHKRKTK